VTVVSARSVILDRIERMADLVQPPRQTVSDFMALPEGTRAELIRGEITILTPAPFTPHQRAVRNLGVALTVWARARKAGEILDSPMDVHLPSGDVVQPDVLFVAAAHAGIVQDWVRGAPDLLIEVLSPSRPARDRVLKREVYAENGVPEYWIVDPDERTVEILRLAGKAYSLAVRVSGGGVITSPLLPGFAMDLAGVFEP
jgi:Uma2 family endonuclease